MRKLFLDDLRSVQMVYPNDNLNDWVIVRDFYQFVNYINKYGLPKIIYPYRTIPYIQQILSVRKTLSHIWKISKNIRPKNQSLCNIID